MYGAGRRISLWVLVRMARVLARQSRNTQHLSALHAFIVRVRGRWATQLPSYSSMCGDKLVDETVCIESAGRCPFIAHRNFLACLSGANSPLPSWPFVADDTHSQRMVKGANSEPGELSRYRLNLEESSSRPFGTTIKQEHIFHVLESYGSVWDVVIAKDGGSVQVTMRQPDAVSMLMEQGAVNVSSDLLAVVKPCFWKSDTPSAEEEERLSTLFSKACTLSRGGNKAMRVTESRELRETGVAGETLEWTITLTNGSTQPRELHSIELSPPAKNFFSLYGKMPSAKRPAQIPVGGTYTQQIKFNGRAPAARGRLGAFSASLLLNFSNFVLEHPVSVTVETKGAKEAAAAAAAAAKLAAAEAAAAAEANGGDAGGESGAFFELLKPSAPYRRNRSIQPDLSSASAADAAAEARPLIRAFPPTRRVTQPAFALYTTSGGAEDGVVPLDEYAVPASIAEIEAGHRGGASASSGRANPWKTRPAHKGRLHEMVHLEEAHTRRLARAYDLYGVAVEKVTELTDGDNTVYYHADPLTRLPCPHLAEKRPSVQVADLVYASAEGAGERYEGFVHRLEADAVLVAFNPTFHDAFPSGAAVDVAFAVERTTPRLMHRAIDAVELDVIWPASIPSRTDEQAAAAEAHAASLELPTHMNPQQRSVVSSLLRREHVPAPFLLYGPFGTGKTSTLLEFLRRLIQGGYTRPDEPPRATVAPRRAAGPAAAAEAAEADGGGDGGRAGGGRGGKGGRRGGRGGTAAVTAAPATAPATAAPASSEAAGGVPASVAAKADGRPRVLVCSPSNSSADHYTLELAHLLPDATSLLRVYAPHRAPAFDKRLRAHTCYDAGARRHTLPPLEELLGVQVVVTTTRSAALLVSAGVPQGHFTHIIVDEAAQLMEAECLIPLSLASTATSVVMAGDPQQLGPATVSRVDAVHGAHCSVMERMQSLDGYAARAPSVCMHLTKNYRSHPSLVKLLSKVSYGGRLEAHAPSERVNALAAWSKRGTKRSFPMLFCGLEGGVEEQEGDSPSVFNRPECSTTLVLIADLLRELGPSGAGTLRQEDVGVITPFHRQTQKMRKVLKERGLAGVRVGSTEEFHGHEVKALFLTTVRTSHEKLDHDALFDTGFVGNVKRFNTALSRAVALAVVVGDPSILSKAPEWAELIKACRDHGCFISLKAPSVPQPPSPPKAAPKAPSKAPPKAAAAAVPSVPPATSDDTTRGEEAASAVVEPPPREGANGKGSGAGKKARGKGRDAKATDGVAASANAVAEGVTSPSKLENGAAGGMATVIPPPPTTTMSETPPPPEWANALLPAVLEQSRLPAAAKDPVNVNALPFSMPGLTSIQQQQQQQQQQPPQPPQPPPQKQTQTQAGGGSRFTNGVIGTAAKAAPRPKAPAPAALPAAMVPPPAPAGPVCLYTHEGEGMLFCEGPPPTFALYERDDSLKLVVSTFNLLVDIEQTAHGFALCLTPDPAKQGDELRLAVGPGGGVPQPCKLHFVVGRRFKQKDTIVVTEEATKVKVRLEKVEKRMVDRLLRRKSGD